jgi:uncharacterized protein (TIGR00369 family)
MADPDNTAAAAIEAERQRLRHFFTVFPFFRLMGFELVDVEPGHARLAMSWREDLCQPAGIMHGGAIASLVDTAIANSILLTPGYMEAKSEGKLIVSVDLRIKYLRPVSAGKIFCDARVTRPGRQIIHTAATVADGEGKEVATGDSIYMIVAGERLKKKTG